MMDFGKERERVGYDTVWHAYVQSATMERATCCPIIHFTLQRPTPLPLKSEHFSPLALLFSQNNVVKNNVLIILNNKICENIMHITDK